MSQIDHFNIVRYHESFVDERTLYIIMDYASGGDLATKIKSMQVKYLWSTSSCPIQRGRGRLVDT